MATYNRPGVYLEEVPTSLPIVNAPTSTIATFIGALAKGPLDPTLITSWSQFISIYGDISANAVDPDVATAVYLFFSNGGSQCYIQRVVVTMSAVASAATTNKTLTVVSATNLPTSDGGGSGAITKGMAISGVGIPAGTTITAVSTNSLTLSQNVNVANAAALTISTPAASLVDLKGNTTAALATQTPVGVVTVSGTPTYASGSGLTTITTGSAHGFSVGQSVKINGAGNYNGTWVTQTGTTGTDLVILTNSNLGAISGTGYAVSASGLVTLTTSAAHNLSVGQTVVIANTAASGHTPTTIYNGTFVVTAVPSNTTFTVYNSAIPVSPLTTAGVVSAPSTTTELTLVAKNPGAWTNGLYYEISNSTINTTYPGKYFSLTIYAGGTTSGYIVERFTDLTLNTSDSNYALTLINAASSYVVAVDPNAANHTDANFANSMTPLSTALTSIAGTSTVATTNSSTVVLATDVNPSFGMSVIANKVDTGTTVAGYVAATKTVTLSANASIPGGTTITFVNAALTGGKDGNTITDNAVTSSSSLAKLDVLTSPMILNAPGVSAASNVNSLLTYAYNRGDVFVIIDPAQTTVDVGSQLSLANSYTGSPVGPAALGYGAVYYPNLTIPSPTSSVPGATVTAYPGGAVAASYVITDNSRGVFKSPAGLEARLAGVVSVPKLTNQELDALNNGTNNPSTFANATPVNAIRYIPGSGIVIMGARTLNTNYNNKYVSVRRSLIYLRSLLTSLTSFAVFETNDQRLWNRLQTTCEATLINFWSSGGLKGETAADAFYVKCDGTINTTASIANGEVHIEIGVALQRPAEFVVIRISQYDSGSVVTVL